MYVFMHACTYVRVYVCAHAYVCTCVRVCTCTCVYVYVYVKAFTTYIILHTGKLDWLTRYRESWRDLVIIIWSLINLYTSSVPK